MVLEVFLITARPLIALTIHFCFDKLEKLNFSAWYIKRASKLPVKPRVRGGWVICHF
jgi:hypothetical protein